MKPDKPKALPCSDLLAQDCRVSVAAGARLKAPVIWYPSCLSSWVYLALLKVCNWICTHVSVDPVGMSVSILEPFVLTSLTTSQDLRLTFQWNIIPASTQGHARILTISMYNVWLKKKCNCRNLSTQIISFSLGNKWPVRTAWPEAKPHLSGWAQCCSGRGPVCSQSAMG